MFLSCDPLAQIFLSKWKSKGWHQAGMMADGADVKASELMVSDDLLLGCPSQKTSFPQVGLKLSLSTVVGKHDVQGMLFTNGQAVEI